jgi:hypothetical protein
LGHFVNQFLFGFVDWLGLEIGVGLVSGTMLLSLCYWTGCGIRMEQIEGSSLIDGNRFCLMILLNVIVSEERIRTL